MQVTKQQVDTCTYTLYIEVPVENVNRAFGRAYREFSEFTKVPGFRPGKAPRAVLERFVNTERLREHVMETLAGHAYGEALEQEKLEPLGDPEVEFGDLAEGEAWRFRARVATQPIVELGDYSDIAVERPVLPVTDADVAETIESIRRDNADIKPVQGRGVQDADILLVDMTINVHGAEPGESRRSMVRVGQNIPGFDDAIMGQMPGETRTFTLTFPDDYSDAERAGKEADFTVSLSSVSERVPPELTDEWVATQGDFADVAAWTQAIRASLEARMQELADQTVQARIIEELIKRATIEFPPAMVREEVQEELARLAQELERGRLDYERYLQMSGITREEHEKRMEEEAAASIRTRLVLRAFAKAESIRLDPTEIEAETTAVQDRAEEAGVVLNASASEQRLRAANSILQRRLRDRLREIATITDAAPATS